MAVASRDRSGNRAEVLDDGFAASRLEDGSWLAGLAFPFEETAEDFYSCDDSEAKALSRVAKSVLKASRPDLS